MTSPKLFLAGNGGDWTVTDEDNFCIGEGETPDEAIVAARKTTKAPIETYWGVVE